MHSPETRHAFFTLRANGHSLRSIAAKLGVSKSILFHWESDPENRRIINSLKSIQIEAVQEKLIPSFEEELQRLSTLLDRVESALAVQDFENMRPEFLLRTAIHLRTRLQKLRCDVHPVQAFYDPDSASALRPGCITRSETLENIDDGFSPSPLNGERAGVRIPLTNDSRIEPLNRPAGLPLPKGEGWGEGEGSVLNYRGLESKVQFVVRGENVPDSSTPTETDLDKNENFSSVQPSSPATSADQNWTRPISRPSLNPLPDETDQIALTACFDSPRPPVPENSDDSQLLQPCSR